MATAGRGPTVEERLTTAERDLRDHAKSLSAHNDALRLLELRTTAIEEARRDRALIEARREEREEGRHDAIKVAIEAVKDDVGDVKKDVVSIKGGGMKLAWIVIGLVAAAVIAFALKGGFNI